MEIKKKGSQRPTKGPTEYFTGNVRIDPIFQAPHPARAVGASVTFERGARTAWHKRREKGVRNRFVERGGARAAASG